MAEADPRPANRDAASTVCELLGSSKTTALVLPLEANLPTKTVSARVSNGSIISPTRAGIANPKINEAVEEVEVINGKVSLLLLLLLLLLSLSSPSISRRASNGSLVGVVVVNNTCNGCFGNPTNDDGPLIFLLLKIAVVLKHVIIQFAVGIRSVIIRIIHPTNTINTEKLIVLLSFS
jgi:hypothetical protein